MLLKSKLTNFIHSDEQWHKSHLGRFSSSQIYKLCNEEGLGKDGLKYIRTRVFEAISGQSASTEFLTESSAEGNANELIALRKYAEREGLEWMLVQKMIKGDNELVVSTPDAILLVTEYPDNYDCRTYEIKCFQAERHMEAIECETPQDVKKFDKKIYYQVIDQMLVADCLIGYLIFYHPALPIDNGGLHIIKFNKSQRVEVKGKSEFPISKDIAFLKQRKELAIKTFYEIRSKLLKII